MEKKYTVSKKELNNLAKRLDLKNLDDALLFPKYFEIETSNLCNANCIMCTIKNRNETKFQFMPDELFNKFVDEVKLYKNWIKVICLARDGEPLIDKNLEKKIIKLKSNGIRFVTFSTNASLLDQNRAISLINSGLDDIMFSVDGFKKETFEKIRKGLSFETVMNNIQSFIKLRNSLNAKTTIRVRMVGIKENEHEQIAWGKYWRSILLKTDRVYIKPLHTWGNQLPVDTTTKNKIDRKNLPCISLWSTVVIHADGIVSQCAIDYDKKIIMGNFFKESIKDIFSSNLFNYVRNLHLEGKKYELPLCNNCELWDPDTHIKF